MNALFLLFMFMATFLAGYFYGYAHAHYDYVTRKYEEEQ